MEKTSWWESHRPSKRRLVQLYSALLYNAHVRGFIEGEIYTGNAKYTCVPGFNCYSCPGQSGPARWVLCRTRWALSTIPPDGI